METTGQRTWKPTAAGILNIVTGAMNVFGIIWVIIILTAVGSWQFIADYVPPQDLSVVVPVINTILILLLVLEIIHTVFPILGGIFALQRKRWGWALAGSIIAILAAFPLGVASTIFVSIARDEFK